MGAMKTRSGLAVFVLATAAAVVVGGCGGGAARGDKAGGSGKPVVLRLANTNGEIAYTPAVEYFVKRVGELSDGKLRIESVDNWGGSAPDAERRVVRDVADGKVDLGWVGTRVFDTLGVESFEALTAPMLVDSYALESAVIESGMTQEMMKGLGELDVAGLGVLPDGLRKPIGVTGPILGPADWRGITFGTLMSNGQADAVRSLGATPAPVHWTERDRRLANGTLQGFETSVWNHGRNPSLAHRAPYVTANVTLWPQMDALLAGPERLGALTEKQRRWLEEAARDAATRARSVAGKDAKSLGDSCATGARFAEASSADLAALGAAFGPVYAELRRHPETRTFIERIRALKESTPAEPALSIPSGCTGRAPAHVTRGTAGSTALDGTYRYVLTQADADKVGDEDTGYPVVNTVHLEDGRLGGGCFGAAGGTYSTEGDRISFYSIEYSYDLTVRFKVDDKGNLHLTPVPPMDPGDAFTCFYKPWRKIEGAAPPKPAPASLNGKYRYVLTRADAEAAVPNAPDLDSYPQVNTWTLRDGRYSNPGGLAGRYSAKGDRISFDVPAFGYALVFRFTVDNEGNLHLTPVPPMNRGDRFVWSYKVWKKID